MCSLGGEFSETLDAKEASKSDDRSMSPLANILCELFFRDSSEGTAKKPPESLGPLVRVVDEIEKKDMSVVKSRFCRL